MRAIKALFIVLIILVLLAGGAAVAMRMSRGKASDPIDVKANIVAVTSGFGAYVFAAKVGPHVIFFDTGVDPQGHPLDAALGALHAGRNDVSDVFLTHGHMDHTAGAGQLDKAKIHLGAGDVALAEGKAEPEAMLGKVFNKVIPSPPVNVSDPLKGTASVDLGDGKTVKAFPVPGHTPGSYAFLYDGVLFVGDIMVFKQGQLEPPPKMFDAHPEENKAAIRSLKMQLAGETVDTVCTAHGGCTPKGLGRNLLEDLISRV
jgi:glyoxylase-like metal-dependent hydrolase (beta-lactamase superfamily II)